ncbi:MAG TPA: FHA domain-containing protein, partial [Gemmatimonadales bacterium]|nr:FHA domain-containing protein [Gemmatimonadales bacterium]
MKARVAHLTGSRAGTDIVVWKSYATIGRAAQADVRLAPDSDLMVAARHAALVWHDGVWAIRDLGSTNGTYVDGSRVHGESVLRDGAVVQLGRDGPTFRFSVIFEAGAPEPVHTSDISAGGDPDALRMLPRIPVILAGGREVVPATPAAPPRARTRWPAVAALVT